MLDFRLKVATLRTFDLVVIFSYLRQQKDENAYLIMRDNYTYVGSTFNRKCNGCRTAKRQNATRNDSCHHAGERCRNKDSVAAKSIPEDTGRLIGRVGLGNVTILDDCA